jgi:Mg-chelatase subunit ChlD
MRCATRRLRQVALGCLAAGLAAGAPLGCSSGEDDGEDVRIVTDDTGRYRAEVDEGLGASIAILVDNSGSMEETASGDSRPKYVVAREAIEAMLAATDSAAAAQPDIPINVGLYAFSGDVATLVPVKRYDREALRTALEQMPKPDGGTAIGTAMDQARADLYRAGTFRKYILVVTDGENTVGRKPRRVAEEIARRSEGAVRMYFVAFDIDAEKFAFVRAVRGEVVGATNGDALRASLDNIYRGKILAEAMDAGETLPDSLRDSTRPPPTKQRSP